MSGIGAAHVFKSADRPQKRPDRTICTALVRFRFTQHCKSLFNRFCIKVTEVGVRCKEHPASVKFEIHFVGLFLCGIWLMKQNIHLESSKFHSSSSSSNKNVQSFPRSSSSKDLSSSARRFCIVSSPSSPLIIQSTR